MYDGGGVGLMHLLLFLLEKNKEIGEKRRRKGIERSKSEERREEESRGRRKRRGKQRMEEKKRNKQRREKENMKFLWKKNGVFEF